MNPLRLTLHFEGNQVLSLHIHNIYFLILQHKECTAPGQIPKILNNLDRIRRRSLKNYTYNLASFHIQLDLSLHPE